MVNGFKMMVLVLCIMSVVTFRANAQQNPSKINLKGAQLVKLNQDIQTLRQQAEPLRLQMRQLLAQMKTLRQQVVLIEDKIRYDHRQMRALEGK